MSRPEAIELLTGLTDSHVHTVNGVTVHRELHGPLEQLQARARQDGIELAVASGFRAFARQLRIWNRKACGEQPVLDDRGNPLDLERLSPRDRVYAILRWSALPGTSRHHWGTDIDVWDCAAVAPAYRLQLVAEEYGSEGPFARLGRWLEGELESSGLGFFRPYAQDRGGVAPEPWHLSHRPLADYYAGQLTPSMLAPVLESTAALCGEEMALRDTVLLHLDDIFVRFVSC